MAIPVERTRSPKARPAEAELGFGKYFTDHMFRVDWAEGRGWHAPRVVPYGPISLDPAASALHYGQAIFEGLKAFRHPGGMRLFRPGAHLARLTRSAERLCIPPVDEALLLDGVKTLLRTDADWLPGGPGTSLYVRPVVFATEAFLGVRPAKAYTLLAFLSPVAGYFSGPPRPLRIWVERERARAARGGIGGAKAAANYVASLLAAEEAKARGFDQVLWLDGAEHRDLEEIGTMNVFAAIGGTVVTPSLEGTILAGVTRDSVLQVLRGWGVPVEERRIELDELATAHRAGRLAEVFGTGTASVVAPIGEVAWPGEALRLAAPGAESLGERLRAEISGIQRGERPDRLGWLEPV
ncbi:branched-chain amino acid aminotransferase [Anaeromyxobacter oryzae]|uniref:Branched-chain-amino-acid aminotransferase n=1 Tax=Anaeromyxobacter oryzae TaxID=2918170 RepID=A0ABM7WRJ6_9BACT|nr:branched-chain amino acid aminotransferase [Anaeromyxobacter oryzae]BDG02095.1 branched-chain-amino-acid aminotransferase 2 [Anaeromyxobacter oryzae]